MTGYEGLRSDSAWIDLSRRGKIRVTGEDRVRWLHAMCTNNIQGLAQGDGLYTFFLAAQGRIVADAYVYQMGGSLFLDTEPETAATLQSHLDKYVIADDVTLEDETAQWATIGLEGPRVAERLAALAIPFPDKAYAFQYWSHRFVARVASSARQGVRIFVLAVYKDEVVDLLKSAAIPEASVEEARVVRIENGIPRYGEDIMERNLAQETEAMHAVHLNKGCYLGQEIVERVRSRGQLHRHLKSIRIKASAPPAPGTKLLGGGKELAEITSAAYSPAFGEVVALGYVRTEAILDRPEMVVSGAEPMVAARLL